MSIVNSFCEWFVKHLTSDTIMVNGKPYLTRHYLWGYQKELGLGRFGIPDYLHFFHASDYDCLADVIENFDSEEELELAKTNLLLHNHPFKGTSYGFILTSGYIEERCKVELKTNCQITQKLCLPWSFNFIGADDFHRVKLLNEEAGAWTLFFTNGRDKNNNWFFLDTKTGIQYHWTCKKSGVIA